MLAIGLLKDGFNDGESWSNATDDAELWLMLITSKFDDG